MVKIFHLWQQHKKYIYVHIHIRLLKKYYKIYYTHIFCIKLLKTNKTENFLLKSRQREKKYINLVVQNKININITYQK
jgi:hypothetical protein